MGNDYPIPISKTLNKEEYMYKIKCIKESQLFKMGTRLYDYSSIL